MLINLYQEDRSFISKDDAPKNSQKNTKKTQLYITLIQLKMGYAKKINIQKT